MSVGRSTARVRCLLCRNNSPFRTDLRSRTFSSRKLLHSTIHNANRILLEFGLAKCIVADRILHGSDLHMRASTCIALK